MSQFSRRKAMIVSAGLLAGALIAVLVLVNDNFESPRLSLLGGPMQIGRERPGSAPEAVNDIDRKIQTQPRAIVALPSADLPLAQQLPLLIDRAEAGDPAASCRLVVSLSICAEARRSGLFNEMMVKRAAAGDADIGNAIIAFAAASEEQHYTSKGFCEGVEVESLPKPDKFFERARPHFSPLQKAVLALMQSDGRLRRLQRPSHFTESGLYVFPQFLADNTLNFLTEGFLAREPLALEGLVLLHAPSTSIGPRGASVWLPNPQLFYFYASLFREIFGAGALGKDASNVLAFVEIILDEPSKEAARARVRLEVGRWMAYKGGLPPVGGTDRASSGVRQIDDLSLCDR